MKPTLQDRLGHMLEAIDEIDALTAQKHALNGIERAALERFFEIVSKASRHIPEALKAQYPDIPWRGIADLGNALRHGYDAIDMETLVKIAKHDMNHLRAVVAALSVASCPPEHS
jgi:uncharacterized protein with HEPN domain